MRPVLQRSIFQSAALCLVLSSLAVPILAQPAPGPDELRQRAIERCKANRGTDCESEAGLREWIMQEQPITDEQRRAAAAARRFREQCKANPKKAGC